METMKWPETDECPLDGTRHPNCFECYAVSPGFCARGKHIMEHRIEAPRLLLRALQARRDEYEALYRQRGQIDRDIKPLLDAINDYIAHRYPGMYAEHKHLIDRLETWMHNLILFYKVEDEDIYCHDCIIELQAMIDEVERKRGPDYIRRGYISGVYDVGDIWDSNLTCVGCGEIIEMPLE